MKERPRVITIDGPAGSGKTTVARMLARHLGYGLLESGTLYRALTWLLVTQAPEALSGEDPARILDRIQEHLPRFSFELGSEGLRIRFDSRRLQEELRLPEVERRVSTVAAIPEVRKLVNDILQRLAQKGPVVAEGRDMGSVVFPEAPYKFFLSASPEVRARRRYLEWRAKGIPVSEEEVLRDIKARDEKDSSRSTAPLSIPEGAIVIDTSNLSPQEVLQVILRELFASHP